MKNILRFAFALGVLFFLGKETYSQCPQAVTLSVQNPSFEGPAQAHVTPSPWTNCLSNQTPDTQPGNWGVTMPPTNGSTYLGLVHEISSGWQEGAAQLLSSPMIAGTTYNFTIDLANSSATGGGLVPGCIELQIWGSNSACDQAQLLWSSGNITPFDVWQTHTVSITPTSNWTYINLLSHSLGCTADPYILVDNMSPIVPTNVSVTTQLLNNVSCLGGNTGQASATATGQNTPFTYAWSSSPPQTGSMLNNVGAGTYTVTATDASGCTATASVVIGPGNVLTLTPTVTHVSCFGGSNGAVNIAVSGGTGTVNYAWNPAAGNVQNRTNAVAGSYSVTATDGGGCTASVSATVTQPAQLTVTGNVTHATCTSTGSVTSGTGGGTPGYTYTWNTTPVQSTASAGNLSGGTYTLTVTDANSCTASAAFVVNPAPNAPTVTLTPNQVLCFGQSNGSITSSVSNGTPGFSYQWSTVPTQTNATASNLTTGAYSVTVRDANNCTTSASATISQPNQLAVSATSTQVMCFGQSTGSASAIVTGGTGNATFSWNTTPVQSTATASNLPAGSYTVTVTDANSCTATASTSVSQPTTAVTATATSTNVMCFGAATGTTTVAASGGTAGYTYLWNTNPTQTSSTLVNRVAGVYTITVTDNNGCTATASTTISQPASPVTVSITLSAPLCFGQPSATATAVATGGTGSHNFVWNSTPPQNTATATNLPAGNYTVTATDANNCSSSASVSIAPAPTALTTTISHNDVLCFGASTGSVTVVASGSYGSYTYLWNSTPQQTSASASQLPAATYTVTVTDLQGCTATASDVVTQPATPISVSATAVDVLCFGDATGSATAVGVGGTGTINYVWSTTPAQNTATAVALVAGSYTVTATDVNTCSQTAQVTINQPAAPLLASQVTTNVLCHGNSTGAIQVIASGGTAAYNYQWSVTPTVNAANAIGLVAGMYSVTVTDANGCSVGIQNMVVAEPTALNIATLATNVSCPNHGDGRVMATVTGGVNPYTYSWNNGHTLPDNNNLNGGVYSLQLTDANGCTASASDVVIELPGVSLTGNATNVLCFPLKNGAVDVTATSSFMPLQFEWSNYAASEDISALDTGSYTVTVTDAHNCKAEQSFQISNDEVFSMNASPDTVTIDLGQTVQLNVAATSSSLGSVQWLPSNGLNCNDCFNPVSSAIDDITYTVNGVDINGCTATDEIVVKVIPKYVLFVPNAFTPNGDGNNDFFEVFGNKEAWKQFHVALFNRWGEKVYESENMNFKWDGSFKSGIVPGVYIYTVKVVYLDNYTDKMYKGSVTLLR